jgi:hypothetical protein
MNGKRRRLLFLYSRYSSPNAASRIRSSTLILLRTMSAIARIDASAARGAAIARQ